MKRTSEEWYVGERKEEQYSIIDFNGWNKYKFNYSWFEEKITYKEYLKRLKNSQTIFTIWG